MSLINQMLRDLDRRCRTAGIEVAVPPGHATVHGPVLRRWRLPAAVAVPALVAVMASLYQLGLRGTDPAGAVSGSSHIQVVKLAIPPRQTGEGPSRRQQPVGHSAASAPVKPQDGKAATPGEQAMAAVEVQLPVEPAPAALVKPAAVSLKALGPEERAAHLFGQAQQSLANGQTGAAEALLEQALSVYPAHVGARRQLASLLIATQRPAAAEALLLEGLQVSPRNADMVRVYAQLLAQRNALQAALEALEGVTADGGGDAETLALQAEILSRLQRFPEAVRIYRRALQLQPDRAVWRTGLAVALEHNAQPDAALDAYRQAAGGTLQNAVRNFVEQRIQVLSAPVARPNG
jgi:predicted Zn-dependent protease